jgi:hypothetical protein
MCDWLNANAPALKEVGPESAIEQILDWLECELIEHPSTTYVTIRGKTADVRPEQYGWQSDSLWQSGNDAIVKRCEVADLERTVKRWRRMARTIEHISVH